MNSAVKRSSVPAPRKDLTRVKRRRTRPPSPIPQLYADINTMDIDQLLATLTEDISVQDVSDSAMENVSSLPQTAAAAAAAVAATVPPPQVGYFTRNNNNNHTSSKFLIQDDDDDDELGGGNEIYRPVAQRGVHSAGDHQQHQQQQQHHQEGPLHMPTLHSLPLAPPPPPPPPPPVPAQQSSKSKNSVKSTRVCNVSEPRLLLRQIYKVASQADAVVGLDSLKDYKPSVYLVNSQSTVQLTFDDLLGLQSLSVSSAIYRFLTEKVLFKPFYLHTVLVESRPNGLIALCNYHLKNKPTNHCINSLMLSKPTDESEIVRQTPRVLLQNVGWSSLKRLFPSIESYYNILVEISPAVQFLISRYSRYFSKHYKVVTLLSANTSTDLVTMTLDKQLVRHITNDLPRLLQELNERRLPAETQDHWYKETPLRTSMLPWIDSEVRRFCVSNIIDSVLDNLKYVARW